MKPQTEQWLQAVTAWHDGIRSDNWTVLGRKGVPPPAAATEHGWRVEAMEGDLSTADLSCLARDDAGQLWFISTLKGWCAVVPLPPRILTSDEKVARARLDSSGQA